MILISLSTRLSQHILEKLNNMPIYYTGKGLSNLEIIKQDLNTFFKISDKGNSNSILVEYKPILDEEYSHLNFELVLFENNYLNAENDVFQIFDKLAKTRIGWIFPLSNLEGTENDFYNNEHLNKYKYVAFQLLLLANGKSITLEDNSNEFSISDIYPNNPIILILSNDNTSKIPDYSIKNYIPSLSKYGYYKQNEFNNLLKFSQKNEFCLKYRGNVKLNLYKSQRDIDSDRFFNELFSKHLKSLEHHLIRFHILYQIIEYILTERFDVVFGNLIEEYNTGSIVKNDFIEKINELGKERSNIKKVVECLSKNKTDFNIPNLERDCKDLLLSHKKKIRNSLGDLIYDIRNLVVHNYRDIEEEEFEIIENITHEMELLTINIIEKYCPQQCA